MPQEVSINAAHTGMVLAEAALDVLGNRLFEAGTVLHERQLRILRAWGVRSISIRTSDADTEESSSADVPAKAPEGGAQTRLEHMFLPHQGNELMERIRRIAEAQLSHDNEPRGK